MNLNLKLEVEIGASELYRLPYIWLTMY